MATVTWKMVQSLQSIPLTKGKEGPIKAVGINLSKELCVGTLIGIIADILMTCFSISLVLILDCACEVLAYCSWFPLVDNVLVQ